jgi:hypothetical protein
MLGRFSRILSSWVAGLTRRFLLFIKAACAIA